MNKEECKILADKMQPLMQLVDIFANDLSDEEIKLLKESKETLSNHISIQHSAEVLTMAFGMETNTLEEEHKLRTLKILIDLIEERKQYKNDLLKEQENKKTFEENRKIIMNIFGNL